MFSSVRFTALTAVLALIGCGSSSDERSEPTAVEPAGPTLASLEQPEDPAARIVFGEMHTCVVKGGQVYCWGDNTEGQLGHGDTTAREHATRVQGLENVRDIATHAEHTCAVLADGSVR